MVVIDNQRSSVHSDLNSIVGGKPKNILVWTLLHGDMSLSEVTQEKNHDVEILSFQKFPGWEKESGLGFLGCTSGRCHVTTNRSLLPKVEMFDAIIFDQFHTHWDDLPTARCLLLYIYVTANMDNQLVLILAVLPHL